MSEHTTGQDGAAVSSRDSSKESTLQTATTPPQQQGGSQSQEPDRGPDQEASSEPKQDEAAARKPVQLKSHFRGMPKDWPINRSKFRTFRLIKSPQLTPPKTRTSEGKRSHGPLSPDSTGGQASMSAERLQRQVDGI